MTKGSSLASPVAGPSVRRPVGRSAHARAGHSPLLGDLLPSWRRYLEAGQYSRYSVLVYWRGVAAFRRWLDQPPQPRSQRIADLDREVCRMFLAAELARGLAPVSVQALRAALRNLFAWLVDEEGLAVNPMDGIAPVKVPRKTKPVLPDADLQKILKACEGRSFDDRRALALVRILIDTGMRRGGLGGLRVGDVDLDNRMLHIALKGGADLYDPIGVKTVQALDRYIRSRAGHRLAATTDKLWLGKKGPLALDSLRRIVRLRAEAAGVPHVYLHLFRHTAAHRWLAMGGDAHDLKNNMGWKSLAMVGVYGASVAAERARAAHKRLAPGDQL